MAIATKNLDTIVREILIEMELPLHFYFKVLYYCLKETDELARRYGMNAKQQTLTLTSYKRAALPSDFVTPIDVSFRNAERLQSLPRDKSLSVQYNYNSSGGKIKWPDADNIWTSGFILYYQNAGAAATSTTSIDFVRNSKGGIYGLSSGMDFTWDIDATNSELVFSNNVTDDADIVLTYVPTTVSSTSANVLYHHFVNTVKAFAHWRKAVDDRAPENTIARYRQDYINAKRVMKAYVSPISYSTLIYNIRKGYFQAPKS